MYTDYDLAIVGASFAGLACAEIAAKNGLSVLVLDKKPSAGANPHTTGILTQEAHDLLAPLPPALISSIGRVNLWGPSLRKAVSIENPRYRFFATDTSSLMDHLAARAQTAGAHLVFETPFEGGHTENGTVIINKGAFRARFLVGADGGRSCVARAFGLPPNRAFLVGAEWECALESFAHLNKNALHVFLTRLHAPGYIGWIVPGPKIIQVGLARTPGAAPNMEDFWDFIAPVLNMTTKPTILAERKGAIPVGGSLRPIFKGNVLLVGDAAGLVSPLTAGGIHTALAFGATAGELIYAYLAQDKGHPGPLLTRMYPRFWAKLPARWLFERTPDVVLDALVALPSFLSGVRRVFFGVRKIT